jgi:hypothetical protein
MAARLILVQKIVVRVHARKLNDVMMNASEIEIADYLIKYYSILLPVNQLEALKHHKRSLKLNDMPDNEARRQLYVRNNWLTDDPEVLKLLDDGYTNFILACADQILRDNPNDVFINLCPLCGRLARTQHAKQCRHCGYDWH